MIQQKNSIRIALDAFPYHNNIHSVCDYGGQQIYAKCALPLYHFQRGILKGLAAKTSSFSHDRKTLTIRIHPDLCWSDGTAITAKHYVDSFKQIIRSKSNRYQSLLADLVGYREFSTRNSDKLGIRQIDQHTIELRLRNINKWLPGLLSQLNFSPLCENPELSAGPYRIVEQDEAVIHLSKNSWYRDHTKNSIDNITFISYERHQQRSKCVADYFGGLIDITCDTVLEYENYSNYQTLKNFHTNLFGLGVFLVPGTHFLSLNKNFRSHLSAILNRNDISQALHGLPKPIHSYSGLYGSEIWDATNTSKKFHPCSLTIIYDDFYPNAIIAECLKAQLYKRGVCVHIKPVRFGDWHSASELRLTICPPIKSGPLGFYKSDLFRGFLPASTLAAAKVQYSLYLQTTDTAIEQHAAHAMEKIISEAGLCVPLVTLPTAALIRPDICPHSVYEVGTPINLLT